VGLSRQTLNAFGAPVEKSLDRRLLCFLRFLLFQSEGTETGLGGIAQGTSSGTRTCEATARSGLALFAGVGLKVEKVPRILYLLLKEH
jgi:hypothetical protein